MQARRAWAVVPAAGRGERFGSGRPKQYETLAGRAVIEWSVSALLACRDVVGVMVALAGDDRHWSTLAIASDSRVHTCCGGRHRSDSVLAGLEALHELGADDGDPVLVHDAARPAVTVAAIEALLSGGDGPSGGLLALPVADTLKREEAGASVATADRSGLWAAQTPQMFPLGTLREALRDGQAQGVAVTDEAQAMERRGYRPRLVPGEAGNIKLTHRGDRMLLEAILKDRVRGQPE